MQMECQENTVPADIPNRITSVHEYIIETQLYYVSQLFKCNLLSFLPWVLFVFSYFLE